MKFSFMTRSAEFYQRELLAFEAADEEAAKRKVFSTLGPQYRTIIFEPSMTGADTDPSGWFVLLLEREIWQEYPVTASGITNIAISPERRTVGFLYRHLPDYIEVQDRERSAAGDFWREVKKNEQNKI